MTFCKNCKHWVKVTICGVCACGAIIMAAPSIAITPAPAATSAQYPVYRAWSPGDSRPFEPAEPDPTIDGPTFAVMGTVPTMHLVIDPYGHWKPSRKHYNGGAAPTI